MSGSSHETIDRTSSTLRRRRRLRTATRVVALVTAVALLTPIAGSASWAAAVPLVSALVSIASLVATGALQAMGWLGLLAGALALVRRRWFCRWACPTGLCADGATQVGLRSGRRCPALPPLGQWIAIVTLGGACVGYPLLLWLDPLALFSSAFGLEQVGEIPSALWCAAGFALVMLVSLVFPGSWCARICPLGALQDLLTRLSEEARRRLRRPRAEERRSPQPAVARRAVLGGILGLVWAAGTRWTRAESPRPLRPPGSIDEERFTGVCIRCGNCARACPTNIIRPDLGQHGMAGLLTPKLDFRDDYCREDCTACTEVCPSGAILPVLLEAKIRARIGVPRVDGNLCLLGDDRECSVCRNRCPYEAIRLVFSEEEYTLTPQVDLDRCPGCGACEAACPTKPTKAIVVRPPYV